MLADSALCAFIFFPLRWKSAAGHQEMSSGVSGVREALAQSDNRGTWALIRLIQCIRGPKLRRLINKTHNVEVSEAVQYYWWVLIGILPCRVRHMSQIRQRGMLILSSQR